MPWILGSRKNSKVNSGDSYPNVITLRAALKQLDGWDEVLFSCICTEVFNCAKTNKYKLMIWIICVISGCSCPMAPKCHPEQVLVVNPEDKGSCCPRKTCECPSRDIPVCIPPKFLKYTNHTCPQPYCACQCPNMESNCTGMLGCQAKGTTMPRRTVIYIFNCFTFDNFVTRYLRE